MASDAAQPNVLMFITHDQGDHLHCYGHETVRSPNLDRMAGEGVRFTHCFNTAPECTPSRAGLYTGQYVHQNGLMGLCHRGWEFDERAVHLARRLWDGGYETCLLGLQHETERSPRSLGYNRLYSLMSSDCDAVCAEVAEFLAVEARNLSRPWFACAGFAEVHRTSPWPEATDFSPEQIEVPAYLPDTPDVRAELACFHQSILKMDAAVGRALEALERSGLARNTLVLFTTDHGIGFPRAKSTFYDPGIRVALAMRWPGRFQAGSVRNELISNLDLCPTLLEACGVEIPEGMEGRSFLPLLERRPYERRDAVHGVLFYDAAYDPMHYVRTPTHKYIRSFAVRSDEAAGADREVLARFEQTGTWIRAGDTDVQRSAAWRHLEGQAPYPVPPAEELYDLTADSFEQNNLAGEPAGAEVLGILRSRMREMMERTDSPLLVGHVSPDLSLTRNMQVVEFK